jgi:hypothetical protein
MPFAKPVEPTDSSAGENASWLLRLAGVTTLMPALLSLCIHLTLFLLLAWYMVPGLSAALATTETDRRGEIVVANTNSQQKTEYLNEGTEEARVTAGSRDKGVEQATSTSSSSGLPSDEPPELPAAVQLPSGAGIGVPAESFLPGVQGGIGAGRNLPSGVDEAAILAEDARGRVGEPAPIGTPGGLSLFGAQGRGRSFAMVIDRSASMGDGHLGAIRSAADELAKQLESLDEKQRVQIVAYHAATSQASEQWLPATEPNKKKLVSYLRGLVAYGSTNHTTALIAALKLKPEVIFLLTDGDDPGMDNYQLGVVKGLARGKTTIHTIQFGKGNETAPADHFMRKLAVATGGSYSYVNVDKLP